MSKPLKEKHACLSHRCNHNLIASYEPSLDTMHIFVSSILVIWEYTSQSEIKLNTSKTPAKHQQLSEIKLTHILFVSSAIGRWLIVFLTHTRSSKLLLTCHAELCLEHRNVVVFLTDITTATTH